MTDEIADLHDQSLGYMLARAHGLFHARLAEAIAWSGLHMGHVLILSTLRAQRELHGESTLTQTRLAAITGIEKSSLVLFLDGLEKDGWVERRRHPTDRRAHIVHLTDEGGRRFEQIGAILFQREQENLAVLTAEERTHLLSLLTRLVRHLMPST